MRLPLTTLEIFVAIAEQGSLRAAAQSLGLQPSTVSHQLKALEEQLGTALFIRTTRSVSLTEAGRALLRGAAPAFDGLASAVESARSAGHGARGALRLALPDFVYQLLVGPALPGFQAAYPEIDVEIAVTDALSDIVAEGRHAGFRLGGRIADDMIAVRLSPPLPLAMVGSPDYLRQHPKPESPADLLAHTAIHYRFQTSGRLDEWRFGGPDGVYRVEARTGPVTNTLPTAIDMARRGLGLVYTFRALVTEDINRERLVPVLDDHVITVPGIHLYYPREYRSMVPLRLFLEHLRSMPDGDCQ